jgi:two-component system OmpR family response regulator
MHTLVTTAVARHRASRSVTLPDSGTPELTSADFALPWALAHHAADVASRDDPMRVLHGLEFDGLDRTIDGGMSRLPHKRQNDASNPQQIKTTRSKGYRSRKIAWK